MFFKFWGNHTLDMGVDGMVLENLYLRKAVAKAGYVIVVFEGTIENIGTKVKYISPNASSLGINVELINKGLKILQDYVHPDDRNKVVATLVDAVNAKVTSYNHEYRMVDDMGNIHYVSNDINFREVSEDVFEIECYIKARNETPKSEKKKRQELRKEELKKGLNDDGTDSLDLKERARKEKFPELMEMFANAYGLYSAFVDIEGRHIFEPVGPATCLGDFYDIFATPESKEYFKFIYQRIKTANKAVVFDYNDTGIEKLSVVPILIADEVRGAWILASYTKEETQTLLEVGENQYLVGEVLSDYLVKSASLDLEGARARYANQRLEKMHARHTIITDALYKTNSKLVDNVDQVIGETLRAVGLNMDIGKIALYSYSNNSQNEFVLRSYWDVAGEAPSAEYLYELPKKRFNVENQIKQCPEHYFADKTNINDEAKMVLVRYNLSAVVTQLIYRNNSLYGILLFGETKKDRVWTDGELRFTKDIALIIKNMLENAEGDDNIRKVNKRLIDTYNNFSVGIFVRDEYSGEILFSNKKMNEMMGRDFVGGNSKEILTNLHDRFDCIIDVGKSVTEERKVSNWKSYIQLFDSIMDITEMPMDWLNGEPATLVILKKAKDN